MLKKLSFITIIFCLSFFYKDESSQSLKKIEFGFLTIEVPDSWEVKSEENKLNLLKDNNEIIFTHTSIDEYDHNEIKSVPTRDLREIQKMRENKIEITEFDLLNQRDTFDNQLVFIRIQKRYNNTIHARAKFQNLAIGSKVFAYGSNLNLEAQEEVLQIFMSIKFVQD